MKKSDASTPKKKAAAKPKPAASDTTPPAPKARSPRKKAATKDATPPAPAPPPVAAAPASRAEVVTTIAARIDVGFGNALFIRGTGPGLNWETGVPMTCDGASLWTIDLVNATRPICCKFLINDETWSTGPDYEVDPGSQLEVTPLF